MLGLRSLGEAIGRVDLLRQRTTGDARADSLDLEPLLADLRPAPGSPLRFVGDAHVEAAGWELGARLADDAAPALDGTDVDLAYAIENTDRTVGATLGGRIGHRFGTETPPGAIRVRFEGTAGQSFGAFLAQGVEITLVGEANDYVGKAMGGGRIAIVPPANDAGDPVLMGNTVLYGATGGELFCAGGAGERFCVRNSGATAVVEGTGDHPCEYMTGGTVAILGPYGLNLGAGMTGGQIFVWDPEDRLEKHLNAALVGAARLGSSEADELRALLERHVELTGSTRGQAILAEWDDELGRFWRVAPKAEVARIESAAEGTVTHKASA
ncbi:MAG: hypothetical protein R3C15_08705 [Thermoleophilia bacterium]